MPSAVFLILLTMFAYPEKEKDSLEKYEEPKLHMERLMKVRLIEFDLSLRILIPLDKVGIRTLGDLTALTAKELMKVNQLGKTSVNRLIHFLADYGLELKN